MLNCKAITFLLSILLFTSLYAKDKPNVVIIICDDLGYGDVEGFAFNEVEVKTPSLNKMAAEGAKLTHFLVTAPYCAPSRSSILTGRYPFRTGIVFNPAPDQGIDHGMRQDEVTFAEIFKTADYDTYYVGKWHLGHKEEQLPTKQGFDDYYGILYSNDMRPVQIVDNEKVVLYPVDQALLTEKYTDKSIEYMKASVKKDSPFLLVLSHAMPHRPLAASKKFYTPETPDDLYHDVIRELDYNIGRLMKCLQELGVDKNTLVMFLSDNGANHGGNTGGLRGRKSVTFEGGLRVPFIARWPGKIPSGTVNTSMACATDIFPTIIKLIGKDLPDNKKIDGRDFMPLLKSNETKSQHEFVISMKKNTIKAIHAGKWKLHVDNPGFYKEPKEANSQSRLNRLPDGKTIIAPVRQPTLFEYPGLTSGDRSKGQMLFNLDDDPGEQKDLSKQFPEQLKRLNTYFEQIKKEVPDNFIPQAKEFKMNPGGQLDFWNIK